MCRPVALCCLVFLSACTAATDDISQRLCPILEKISTESGGKAAIAVQTRLITEVADAYQFKQEPLNVVLDDADASTTKACPDARAAVLKLVGMETLRDAMR